MFRFFGKEIQNINVPDFGDVIEMVKNGKADYGVLPIENSSAGFVNGIYDMVGNNDVTIVGEEEVHVAHALMGVPGSDLSRIKTVYSHTQGLLQCANYLSRKPWKQCSVANTAVAAVKVIEEGDKTQAAIASELAAELYGLQILAKDIVNNDNNTTRFIILSKQKIFVEKAENISIRFNLSKEKVDNLKELTKKLNLTINVIFTDKVLYDQVPSYYNLFNVVASFSKTETQGLTIIEGLASSKPTLCINDESFKATIIPNYNGYLFNSDKEFIDEILKLLTNKKLYKEMSTNAKNSTYKYSKEVFASDILKVYHKAIEKKIEGNQQNIVVSYEMKEDKKSKISFSANFENLESLQNIKENYELELQFELSTYNLKGIQSSNNKDKIYTEEEKIKMMLNQAIAEGMLDGESTSSITKENLEKARNNDNSEFYENMQIENISGGQIQIKFSDTGDIFKLDNNGKIISSPEVTESSTTTDVDSEVVVYKYNFSNDVNFTDSATVEDFSSDNSLMLTDYDSDQVSSFLNAVVERISEVNEQQMGQLGLEASENPIVNIIPSIGLYLGNMNVLNQVNSNMSEAEINNFNQKFEAYESTNLKGVTVKGLLSTISLNNQSEETSNEIKEINYNGEEYEASEQNITLIKGEIDTEKSYRVEFEKDQDTGLIYRAVINEK